MAAKNIDKETVIKTEINQKLYPTVNNLEITKLKFDDTNMSNKKLDKELDRLLKKEICNVLLSVEEISPNEEAYRASMNNAKPLFELYSQLDRNETEAANNKTTALAYDGGIALVCLLELGGRVLLSKGLSLLPKPKMK